MAITEQKRQSPPRPDGRPRPLSVRFWRLGLPPTPIDNPGEQALHAAINPTPGNWLYFVTVAPGDTRFTASYREHQRNVYEFNSKRKSSSG